MYTHNAPNAPPEIKQMTEARLTDVTYNCLDKPKLSVAENNHIEINCKVAATIISILEHNLSYKYKIKGFGGVSRIWGRGVLTIYIILYAHAQNLSHTH